jgi:hypothetical protein
MPPAGSRGIVKQLGSKAAFPVDGYHAPELPVRALLAVQLFDNGTIGFVMPFEVE